MSYFKFAIGATLRDVVTGFEGVVMGRTEYATGCIHYGLCSRGLKDGIPLEWQWFDESRLSMVSGKVIIDFRVEKSSGPYPNAPSM